MAKGTVAPLSSHFSIPPRTFNKDAENPLFPLIHPHLTDSHSSHQAACRSRTFHNAAIFQGGKETVFWAWSPPTFGYCLQRQIVFCSDS
jgi:hypothetical protein